MRLSPLSSIPSWLPSLVLTVLIILLIPFEKGRYNVEVKEETYQEKTFHCYHDLDMDGIPEKVITSSFRTLSYIVAGNANGSYIDQWNFNGRFHSFSDYLFFADITGDNKEEIIAFYERNDSLFLLAVNAFHQHDFLLLDVFIDHLRRKFDNTLYRIQSGKWADLNQDGLPELYFALYGDFAIKPRDVYKIDFTGPYVSISDLGYPCITGLFFSDINMDGRKEILLSTSASGNVHSDSLPGSDRFSWNIVLDENLQALFPPRKEAGLFSYFNALPFPGYGGYLGILFNYTDSTKASRLSVHGPDGKISDSIWIDDSNLYASLLNNQNQTDSIIFLFDAQHNVLYKTDRNLNLKKAAVLKENTNFCLRLDLLSDSLPEYLFHNPIAKHYVLLDEHFKEIFRFQSDAICYKTIYPAVFSRERSKLSFGFSTLNSYLRVTGTPNLFYYLRFPAYILIFLSFWFLFSRLKRIWERQLREKLSLERKMMQFQLNSLSNQLDPHLTFNLLNNIAYSIYQQEGEEIHSLFTRFTTYMHKALLSSDKIIVPLKDELEFTDSYLHLQKARMKDRLNWKLELDENVPVDFSIPRMAVQNLVENSVKHGLQPKKEGGFIEILVFLRNNKLVISVKDNGSGKNSSALRNPNHTGKGLSVLRQFFELLNHSNPGKASVSLHYPEDGKGAVAILEIPLGYQYQ